MNLNLIKGNLYQRNDHLLIFLGDIIEKYGGGWVWYEYKFLYGKNIIYIHEDLVKDLKEIL